MLNPQGIQLLGMDSNGNLLVKGPGVSQLLPGSLISVNYDPYVITKNPYLTDDGVKCTIRPLAGFSSNGRPLTDNDVEQIEDLNSLFYNKEPEFNNLGLDI